jgi:hypothetical protein
MNKKGLKINGNLIVLIIALVVVIGVFSLLNRNYFTTVNMVNILIAASLVGLVAIGHTYLIIEGQNDLSPGSLVAFLGVLSALLDLDDPWDVPNDSTYHVRVRCRVPVDGVGMPDMSLATWRQVCSNGAVAEAPLFRTKMEIKDNSGEHFRRLLASFSNPSGVETLQERMCTAAGTKASVAEVVLLEGLIRRSVANTRNQMLLRERLDEISGNPCVRYGVTDLANIGQKKRPLLPVGCSVADLLNFASELTTHHADLLKPDSTLHSFAGTLLSKGFDLEDLYPNARRTSAFYLNGVDFSKEAA